MPQPGPKALRRIVSGLAALHADDVAAILDALGPAERKAVQGLLGEHTAYFDPLPAKPADAGIDKSRFSPWLIERLDPAAGVAMTEVARLALRKAIMEAPPPAPVIASAPAPRRGLFSRKAPA